MKRIILTVLCGLSLAGATTWAGAQGKPTSEAQTTQVQDLKRQIQGLQQVAGLTPLKGPGVVVHLQDNPHAAQCSALVDCLVHDYDLLEVVNVLRAAHAEAIAVNGVRFTAYTAITCEGPSLYVGNQALIHPYKIEAIGNPVVLQRQMSSGLIEHLKQSGVGVRLVRASQLQLARVTTTPSFQYGKPK